MMTVNPLERDTFSIYHVVAICGYMLFAAMLVLPTAYRRSKAVLLAIVTFGIIVRCLKHPKLRFYSTVILWTMGLTMMGLGFVALGIFNNEPGATQRLTVYVLWPLLFLGIIIGGIRKRYEIRNLLVVLVIATLIISLHSFSFILHAANLLPSFLYIPLELDARIGFYSGFIEYNLDNITSLLFLVPFLLTAALTWPRDIRVLGSQYTVPIALGMSLLLVIVSGRRGLQLVVAASPIFIFLYSIWLPEEERRRNWARIRARLRILFPFIVIGIVLFLLMGIRLSAIIEQLLLIFNPSKSASMSIRQKQFHAFLRGIRENPFIGTGFGSAAPGFVRVSSQPWRYELYYMGLIYRTGLVGFTIYAAAVLWIVGQGLRMIRYSRFRYYMLPTLVGMTTFLLANATNPYLPKFDYMWIIFLPVALIHYAFAHEMNC